LYAAGEAEAVHHVRLLRLVADPPLPPAAPQADRVQARPQPHVACGYPPTDPAAYSASTEQPPPPLPPPPPPPPPPPHERFLPTAASLRGWTALAAAAPPDPAASRTAGAAFSYGHDGAVDRDERRASQDPMTAAAGAPGETTACTRFVTTTTTTVLRTVKNADGTVVRV
jgi:hypothetical protein